MSSNISCKDSTNVVSTDLSDVDPVTRRKFKNSELDGSKYITYLKTIKNNNSHMMVVTTIPKGNFAFVFF
ncbi:hypothetical protein R3W88_033452 [Solanum pinnatisectum]|uniref:Uncharacterized protein n=1 Tax=Solanum pinnatisectum TaxID=50273 RepID=A0AAV9K2N6_9SOLN|nr:hypothetical protein R3W88_033452 [Solanum pinnatisectum]